MTAIFPFGYYLDVSLILVLGAIALPISRKMSVVEIPILVFLGIIIGPMLHLISPNFSVYLFSSFAGVGIGMMGLVIILYSESHNMNLKVLRSEFYRIASLDTLGVIITAVVAGLVFTVLTGAPIIVGFLFGAIVSPTDPVTLIPLFRRVKVSEDISEILVGESLFNDPVGIILVSVGIALLAPQSSYVSLFSAMNRVITFYPSIVAYFLIQVAVPSIVGIAIGFSVIYLDKKIKFENYLTAMLLGLVIFEFTVFESLSITPFPAIIATGAIVGNFSDKNIFWSREQNFQESLSFLSAAIIFILIGSSFTLSEIVSYILLGIALTILIVFLVRPLAVFPSLMIADARKPKMKSYYKIAAFISLVGPRGVVPVVLSTLPYVVGEEYNIPVLVTWGPLISVSALFVVLFSIVLQTLYTPIIRNIFLPDSGNGSEK
ncbi:Na+/H+ antiporter related protein [Thermoplasma acidophilum]|uniref:Na+/H+ antiporter related protein n=1 Tax=Thermoplasma acidophilum (strain ATCC 25905 / DSM 1728 / JCM 9062 / NBRC 15155 / AMRC-C165) TaxID=273075 RepID=Q9HJR7_THEAC|nr:sodium:proton antiporter [Thermoplasma acidophilum]CAC12029.1 Na+/H+ antiporter related protein [Thermoplasma acidophilum]